MKVKEVFELWLEKYAKPSVKIRSFNKYEFIVNNYIYPILGDLEIDEINCAMMQEYICKLLNMNSNKFNTPLAVNTIYGIVQVLKQGFKLAIELELISKNPTLKIKLPQISEKEVLALSREEQKNIESFCLSNSKANYIGVIISLYTGVRLGELLALTWDNIDFDKKLMTIKKTSYSAKIGGKYVIVVDKPKTKKSNRIIPLPDKLINLLLIHKNNTTSDYIISTRNNTIVEVRSYQRTFDSILSKCNIKHYNYHCLRHTFATRALELGMDIKTLSEILGHTSVSITLNRYAHSLLEYKIQEMNKISSLL